MITAIMSQLITNDDRDTSIWHRISRALMMSHTRWKRERRKAVRCTECTVHHWTSSALSFTCIPSVPNHSHHHQPTHRLGSCSLLFNGSFPVFLFFWLLLLGALSTTSTAPRCLSKCSCVYFKNKLQADCSLQHFSALPQVCKITLLTITYTCAAFLFVFFFYFDWPLRGKKIQFHFS